MDDDQPWQCWTVTDNRKLNFCIKWLMIATCIAINIVFIINCKLFKINLTISTYQFLVYNNFLPHNHCPLINSYPHLHKNCLHKTSLHTNYENWPSLFLWRPFQNFGRLITCPKIFCYFFFLPLITIFLRPKSALILLHQNYPTYCYQIWQLSVLYSRSMITIFQTFRF